MKLWIGLAGLVLAAAPALADSVVVATDAGTTNTTTGLTGFATSGDMMDGMAVQVWFSDGSTEIKYWADTGGGAGAATGTGWSLAESGNTFGSDWTFTNTGSLAITSFVIDAGVGDTVFDLSTDAEGTPGSASGWSFTLTGGGTGLDILATYRDLVALTAALPVGDLYRRLDVDFTNVGGFGSDRSLTFIADTDNLKFSGDLTPVPEPATLALFGLGAVGAAWRRRRTAAR